MSGKKNNNSIRNSFVLFLTAFIWGTSFVAQSAGMEYIGPFTFSVVRYIMGGLVLIPVIICIRNMNKKKGKESGDIKLSIKCGIICGIILCAASNFQQMAMLKASAGKAGFITALYIIMVPILGIFFKKKNSPIIWLSVLLALVGLYFLCIGRGNSFHFVLSDIQLLICSLIFSFHILYIDHANAKGVDGIVMSSTQFLVAAVISVFFVYPMDSVVYNMAPTFQLIRSALPALCYSGLMACGVAYTLQIIGQKDVNPTVASLIMSLESVVSAISGFVVLRQKLSVDEIIGCVIMFVAIILAELPIGKKEINPEALLQKE
ncbi:Permease of the drug/metabolite transporter (DMT) superfamily [Lachnospiraceae bacterium NE2001]|nr:Permease of the drug/metabolite transporter (DMT) superfamily [Lachnospiraceae bacterium NE2001]